MNKLTIIVDASAFSDSACLLRLFNTVIRGYTGKVNNNDVEFGTAFHKFRAHFRDKGETGFGEAVNKATNYYETKPMHVKPNKKYLTKKFLMECCISYAATYSKDRISPVRTSSGEALLELKFAFPFYIDNEIEVLLAGTMDELGKINNGIYVIVDAKTTSSWDPEEYFAGYNLSPQMIFYRWVLRKYAEMHPSSIFADIENSGPIGIIIDGIFHKGGDNPSVLFDRPREVIMFKDSMLQEFEMLVADKVNSLVFAAKMWMQNKIRPPRFGLLNGACTTKYGLCPYAIACSAPDETTMQIILDNSFTVREYNPLKFDEVVI